MQDHRTQLNRDQGSWQYITSQSISLDLLCELGRATTAYHEALPHRMERARLEYEEALRRFNATRTQILALDN